MYRHRLQCFITEVMASRYCTILSIRNTMSHTPEFITEMLYGQLRREVTALGTNGGILSPSVYDTAQVLRFSSGANPSWPTVDWLLSQQQPDGGWGDPAIPRTRDIPTLAAMIALSTYDKRSH